MTSWVTVRQMRRIIRHAPWKEPEVIEDFSIPVILVMDTTYFPEGGVMVFRCWHRKRNLHWSFVREETNESYLAGVHALEERGCKIPVIVIDGKKWLAETLYSSGYEVQLCQFHIVKTVTRYLTKHPKLPAGKELRWIILALKRMDESSFRTAFETWQERWRDFLKERSVDPATGSWQYTHRRIRAAERSIVHALPYLFTFERLAPAYDVPTTTNTLDGSFSQLKQKVHVHRGLNSHTKQRMISTLLAGPKKKVKKHSKTN